MWCISSFRGHARLGSIYAQWAGPLTSTLIDSRSARGGAVGKVAGSMLECLTIKVHKFIDEKISLQFIGERV